MSKHSAPRKKLNIKKVFSFIFLILLIILSIFFINFIKEHKFQKTTLNESEIKHNNNEEIISTKTVENAEYLEITGLDITCKDGFSTIKTTIKNNSSDTLTNFRLDISIFDSNNNLVTELSNPIKSISPDESVESFGVVNKDISDTYTYIVKKN